MSTAYLKFLCEFMVVPKLIGHPHPNFLHNLWYAGHSVWLFFCSLYILSDQCLLHLHPTHKTDLPAYLTQDRIVTFLAKGQWAGVPLLVSLIIMGPPDSNSPTTSNLPSSPGAKIDVLSFPAISHRQLHRIGSCSRTFFRAVNPLNH